MRIYWINELEKGNLGMMARPKGNDWLENEVITLKRFEVDTVISLLEKSETLELEIEREKELYEKWEIEFINYPIKDRSVPKDLKSFQQLILMIDEKLKQDKKLVIHCRMGIGRTSVLAAGVLIRNGFNSDEVFGFLSGKRTLKVPDTEEQKAWIQRHSEELI